MESAYPYLSKIISPQDVRKLSDKELAELAKEVRQAILDNVSRTGGHFSSNLGTVELTVAMYAAYNIPPDKVIWDTGHQAYPHKLLTGRLPRFDTLRMHKGLSGFLKRDEHELDVFGAGHAGTAISAALGFAAARDQAKGSEKVVAIAGDAAICAGMSWEALNHAGELQTDLCVVLNDNRMSIAPNVGALTNYFNRLRSRPQVQGLARQAKKVIEKIPGPAPRIAAGLRHGVTHYFAPEETGTIFEEMGFEYIGPVDGHDLPTLLEIFRNIQEVRYPVFIHALTVKGKGYNVAEEDATKWHGVVPFDLEQCEMPSKAAAPTYTSVFGDAITELGESDEKVIAITAAMPDGTGLNGFRAQLPGQYYDVGIAEQHGVTFAAGMAAGGYKPFTVIYSTFLQRGYDQVLHDVCIQNLPVRFAMDRAGLVGDDGPTHHGTFDISFLTHIPNMSLCAPRDATELREMLKFMAEYEAGPSAIRYPRGNVPDNLPEGRTPIEFGKAEVLGVPGVRRGDEGRVDAVIVAVGSMVTEAWDAASQLGDAGVQALVINARWCKPIDWETVAARLSPGTLLVTVEENVRTGGFGQQLIDLLVESQQLPQRVKVMALPDAWVTHGKQPIIRGEVGLDAAGIVETVRTSVLGRGLA
ncbi:1-deoxy-D-xylulose-5-phosphate synthase [Armatimonadetes bacterium Uphvl-Ar1]|nr:1-deoxy-D-xylulose-5-phosphate synthase [Armatimonadetes bacterium Uphvl-Ar1]